MAKELNKNISIWRGDETPPTNYHLWIKSDNLIYIHKDNEWQEVTGIKKLRYIKNIFRILDGQDNTHNVFIEYNDNNNVYFPEAQYYKDDDSFYQGLLSKFDYLKTRPISNLGSFDSNKDGENKAIDLSTTADTSLIHYEKSNYPNENDCSTILQSISHGEVKLTTQLLLQDGKIWIRRIKLPEKEVDSWRQCLPTGLKYEDETDKHGFRFQYFGEDLADYDDNTYIDIPAFDGTNNPNFGLISKDYKENIDNSLHITNNINSVTRVNITPVDSESYVKSYKITQGSKAYNNLTEIGTINIPKDMVVDSGSLKTATQEDVTNNLYENIKIGDKYIDLVIANSNNDHIYIPVTDLIDVYLAGDGLSISNNKFSIKKDATSENYLSVSSNGLKISGINSRFNNIEPTVNKLSEIYNEKPLPSFKLKSASITIVNNSNAESKINVDLSKQYQIIQIVKPKTIKVNCSIKINTDNCKEIIRTSSGLNKAQTEYTFDKAYTTSNTDNQNTIYGITESIYCNKSGLMVSNSKVIPATGEDSNTFKLCVNFKWKYYLGTLNPNVQYQTLINTSKTYSTKKDITINNVSTSDKQYYVYIYPKIFGELTSVIQNGALPVLDAFNKQIITITNEYGLVEDYYVYKSNNPKPFTNSNLTFK